DRAQPGLQAVAHEPGNGLPALRRRHAAAAELEHHPRRLGDRRQRSEGGAVRERRLADQPSHGGAMVTAPSDALDTCARYFASTPSVMSEAGRDQRSRRRASSASVRSTSMRRRSASMVMRSPSSSSAIGPPTAASGDTWPTTNPWLPPEKRPSVISATSAPSPLPMIAPVGLSISRIPGPPFGPS